MGDSVTVTLLALLITVLYLILKATVRARREKNTMRDNTWWGRR